MAEMGGGVLWKNKQENVELQNPGQLAKVKERFTKEEITVIRDLSKTGQAGTQAQGRERTS